MSVAAWPPSARSAAASSASAGSGISLVLLEKLPPPGRLAWVDGPREEDAEAGCDRRAAHVEVLHERRRAGDRLRQPCVADEAPDRRGILSQQIQLAHLAEAPGMPQHPPGSGTLSHGLVAAAEPGEVELKVVSDGSICEPYLATVVPAGNIINTRYWRYDN